MIRTITPGVLLLYLLTAWAAYSEEQVHNGLAASLEAAYDACFETNMEALHIPGAAIAVVHEGQILFAKGYGHARLEPLEPVTAEETLFRIGSVTKVITAMATMQCVARGLLHLDAPVNQYLEGWQVSDQPGGAVTLRHLLTHTAGFDDRFLELGVPSPEELEPLGTYLQRRLPARVEPPGQVFNYSNFGITLAAHLIEQVSGRSFIEFTEEHLFAPLSIHPGGFDQPLSPEMYERLAHTYAWNGRHYVPSNWRDAASQVYPAGAYATTVLDMARFMNAHLHDGQVNGERIVDEALIREMHRPHFVGHPALRQQQALGFHLREHNGQQLVWHTGRVDMFTAQMVLAPALKLGVFVACNADTGDQLRNEIVDILAQHFFPEPPEDDVGVAALDKRTLRTMAGAYRQSRHVRHSFAKLGFIGQEIYFRPDEAGRLVETRFMASTPTDVWAPVAGYDGTVFAAMDADQPRRLAFIVDERGRPHHAFVDRHMYTVLTAYERLRWYEHTAVQIFIATLCLLVFVVAVIRWPLLALFRRGGGHAPHDEFRIHATRILAGIMGLCFLVFCIGLGLSIALTDMYLFAFGLPWRIAALLLLPLCGAAAWIALLAAVIALRGSSGPHSRGAWYHGIATCAAGGLFLVLLYYWNLIG